MTVSNKHSFLFFRWVLAIFVTLLLADIALSQIQGSISQYFENHWLALVSGVAIAALAFSRINYFSYEDDYEIIHIRSQSLIFGRFSDPAQTRYEFPKRTITDFKLKKGFLQSKLTINLATQHGTKRIRKFDVSFVPVKKMSEVLDSLGKIKVENIAGDLKA